MNCPDCGKFTKKQIWNHPPVPSHVVWWCGACGWGYGEVDNEIVVLSPDAYDSLLPDKRCNLSSHELEQRMREIGELDVVNAPLILEMKYGSRRH
jgi:hypothetical protein